MRPGPRATDPIDHVLALDLGGRGIAAFFRPGAAAAAGLALRQARRVLIVTGFCVAGGAPETDGPPGAAVLGRALRALGARVRYVTDRPVMPVLSAALGAVGEPDDVEAYPDGERAARAVLDRARPTHLVAIERPGRTRSGDYLSARAESIAPWNRPLDELFVQNGGPRRATTVAVGDGGNEIGMGSVRARILRVGGLLARTASVVPADHLVVAGTSNWGAYGIAAALGRRAGRDLLHTAAQERALVEACVRAGAVDGITRRPEPTVDGLGLDVHGAVVELLRTIAASGMIGGTSTRRSRRP